MFDGFTPEQITAVRASVDKFRNEISNQNAKPKGERLTKGNKSSAKTSEITQNTNKNIIKSDEENYNKSVKAYNIRRVQRPISDDLHKTLSLCGLGIISNPDGSPGTGRFMCSHENGAVHQTGFMTCHSPWACPVCSPKVAARRAMAIKPQIESRIKDGWTLTLVTLTVRHERKTSLNDMFNALSRAWGKVTSGRWWDNLKNIDDIEFVRGNDVTYSERYGWHPHLHIALLLGPAHSDEDVSEEILRRWIAALKGMGWSASRQAQHFDRADDPEKAARYAVTPAAVYESLAMAMKKNRGKSAGFTPFEILERAAADHQAKVSGSKWVALWREYVAATKGKRQAVTSQGLTFEPEASDDKTPLDEVLNCFPEVMRELDDTNTVPEVLKSINDNIGDPEGMRESLAEVMGRLKGKGWKIPEYGDDARTKFRTELDEIDRELARADEGRGDEIGKAMQRMRERIGVQEQSQTPNC